MILPEENSLNRSYDLNLINLSRLPINWQALGNVVKIINEIKNPPLGKVDPESLRSTSIPSFAIPIIASMIANNHDSRVEVISASAAEIKEMKSWLGILEKTASVISRKLSRRLNSLIEDKSQQIMQEVSDSIINFIEQLANIENPQDQFLLELTQLYNHLALPTQHTVEGLMGDYQELTPIDRKIRLMLQGFREARGNAELLNNFKESYPLLTTILSIEKLTVPYMGGAKMKVASAHLMAGVRHYLSQETNYHLEAVPPVPNLNLTDLIDVDIEVVAAAALLPNVLEEKMKEIRSMVPRILHQVYSILPPSGPEFSKEIHSLAQKICILKKQGYSDEKIVSNLFK